MEWEEWQELEWETVVNKKDKRLISREQEISNEKEKILSEQKEISREKKAIERVKKTILREQTAISREIAVKEIIQVKNSSKESKDLKVLKTFANNLTRGGRRVKIKSRTRETEILLYMRKINESNENVQMNLPQTPQMCLLWNSITWSYSPIHI